MKYYNKNPKLRKTWTHVLINLNYGDKLKMWCVRNGSKSRFYFGKVQMDWYFENSEDATAFSLKWKHNGRTQN